jgi:hypothetical protein
MRDDLVEALGVAMRQLGEAMREQAKSMDRLAAATKEAAAEQRALRNELRVGREKQVRTSRVKALRAARSLQDVPVSDVAATSARRTIAKLERAGR